MSRPDVAEVEGSFDGSDDGPQAWVGCLRCYNAGALVGAWVPGTEAGEFEPHTARGLAGGLGLAPCGAVVSDERWVFTHEGYGAFLPGECSPAEAQRAAELMAAIEDESSAGWDDVPAAVAAWKDHTGAEVIEWDAPTREAFEEAFNGRWDSEEEFAEQLADDLGLIPDQEHRWPTSYIDWERATRDLFMGDYWSTDAPGGGVFVFRSI